MRIGVALILLLLGTCAWGAPAPPRKEPPPPPDVEVTFSLWPSDTTVTLTPPGKAVPRILGRADKPLKVPLSPKTKEVVLLFEHVGYKSSKVTIAAADLKKKSWPANGPHRLEAESTMTDLYYQARENPALAAGVAIGGIVGIAVVIVLLSVVMRSLRKPKYVEVAPVILTPRQIVAIGKIGHFAIADESGETPRGITVRGLPEDGSSAISVAIKLLSPQISSDGEFRSRLERKIPQLQALKHPLICEFYEVDEESGVVYIVSEWLRGTNMGHFIRVGGMQMAEFLCWYVPTMEAVIAAHAAGVVHGDLKPSKVMNLRDGGVKVMDFGLAPYPENRGSEPYMAPELLSGGRPDEASDQYSLGVMAYLYLTGTLPQDAKASNPLERIPPALAAVVRRMMNADRPTRYPSIQAALDDLKAAIPPPAEPPPRRR